MIENLINSWSILPGGWNTLDMLFIIIIILILTNIFSAYTKSKLKKEIKLLPGFEINQNIIKQVENINQQLSINSENHRDFNLEILNLKNRVNDILDIKTLRYNPYKDMGVGGSQSFSTVILDKNGNGVVITNLYSRERTRVLLKEIENFYPKQELAPEEKEVLNLFRNS